MLLNWPISHSSVYHLQLTIFILSKVASPTLLISLCLLGVTFNSTTTKLSSDYPNMLSTSSYHNSTQATTSLGHKKRHEKHHQTHHNHQYQLHQHQSSHQLAKSSKCHPLKVHRSRSVYLQPLCSKNYLHITGKTVRATRTSHISENAFHITGMAIRGKKFPGTLVNFKGIRSGKYICYNKKGKIVAKENGQWDLSCIFREYFSNGPAFKYQSFYNKNWYLGFDHKGRPIRGTVNRHRRRKNGSRKSKIDRHCYEFSKINIKPNQ